MFAYCLNNPVNRTDEAGTCPWYIDTDGTGRLDESLLRWLTMEYQGAANCYAFAFQLANDPRTGSPFLSKPQPGEFANKSCIGALNTLFDNIMAGGNVTTDQIRNVIISAAKADGEKLGFSIVEIGSANYPTTGDQWIVALGFGVFPVGYDYHWWRKMDDGLWYHKPGSTPVRDTDASGQPIYDPGAADRGIYQYFLGYYVVIPSS